MIHIKTMRIDIFSGIQLDIYSIWILLFYKYYVGAL